MNVYFAEFIGTALMIILGDGVVANVNLKKSNMSGGGSIQITLAWGFAVFLPAFIFGNVSGAYFNPAVVLGMAIYQKVSWICVPGYLLAEFLGGCVGALIVYVFFKDQFKATEDASVILQCFCTKPAIKHKAQNMICEMIATFILVYCLLNISNFTVTGASGMNYIFVFALISSIGMSLGGTTGYAINPVRDFCPRLIHSLIPIKNKGTSEWDYAYIPILGPMIGALIASGLFLISQQIF